MGHELEPGADTDVVGLLRRDHARIRALLAAFDTATAAGSGDDRWATYGELSDLLIRHEVAEELAVYPALAGLRGGSAVSGSRLADQGEIEELLVALDREQFGSPHFDDLAVRLGLQVLVHLDKEEGQVLPLLATFVGTRCRAQLGVRYLEATAIARAPKGATGVSTGPAVVDRTTAVATFMRDTAGTSELAS